MLSLNADPTFHFELLRCTAHARYEGSDVADVLSVADSIKPGSFESWHDAFAGLARQREGQAMQLARKKDLSPSEKISLRDRMFAIAGYYRAADFYLHGNPEDPRINEYWEKQTRCFDRAIGLLEYEAKRYTLKADSFEVPIIFYKSKIAGSRPTIIMGNGYDGAQEEMLHISGVGALQRGYNVITYEGPGQPTVVRGQGKGFIFDWERVVTPVVDFAVGQSSVDPSKIALYGYSFGGYLSVRAAAFEHRLSAVVAIDGVYDFSPIIKRQISPELLRSYHEGSQRAAFDKTVTDIAYSDSTPAGGRWALQQGLWSFQTRSPAELFDKASECTLEGIVDKVQAKVFIGDAEDDIFFEGQPELAKKHLGDKGTLRFFGSDEAANGHCQVGAAAMLNSAVFDWLDEVIQ